MPPGEAPLRRGLSTRTAATIAPSPPLAHGRKATARISKSRTCQDGAGSPLSPRAKECTPSTTQERAGSLLSPRAKECRRSAAQAATEGFPQGLSAAFLRAVWSCGRSLKPIEATGWTAARAAKAGTRIVVVETSVIDLWKAQLRESRMSAELKEEQPRGVEDARVPAGYVPMDTAVHDPPESMARTAEHPEEADKRTEATGPCAEELVSRQDASAEFILDLVANLMGHLASFRALQEDLSGVSSQLEDIDTALERLRDMLHGWQQLSGGQDAQIIAKLVQGSDALMQRLEELVHCTRQRLRETFHAAALKARHPEGEAPADGTEVQALGQDSALAWLPSAIVDGLTEILRGMEYELCDRPLERVSEATAEIEALSATCHQTPVHFATRLRKAASEGVLGSAADGAAGKDEVALPSRSFSTRSILKEPLTDPAFRTKEIRFRKAASEGMIDSATDGAAGKNEVTATAEGPLTRLAVLDEESQLRKATDEEVLESAADGAAGKEEALTDVALLTEGAARAEGSRKGRGEVEAEEWHRSGGAAPAGEEGQCGQGGNHTAVSSALEDLASPGPWALAVLGLADGVRTCSQKDCWQDTANGLGYPRPVAAEIDTDCVVQNQCKSVPRMVAAKFALNATLGMTVNVLQDRGLRGGSRVRLVGDRRSPRAAEPEDGGPADLVQVEGCSHPVAPGAEGSESPAQPGQHGRLLEKPPSAGGWPTPETYRSSRWSVHERFTGQQISLPPLHVAAGCYVAPAFSRRRQGLERVREDRWRASNHLPPLNPPRPPELPLRPPEARRPLRPFRGQSLVPAEEMLSPIPSPISSPQAPPPGRSPRPLRPLPDVLPTSSPGSDGGSRHARVWKSFFWRVDDVPAAHVKRHAAVAA